MSNDNAALVRKLRVEQAMRIASLIAMEAPAQIIADELCLLFVRLKKQYGREFFDEAIARHQKVSDARENGTCDMCFENPSIGGDSPQSTQCSDCSNLLKQHDEEMDREIAIEKAMDSSPLGHKPS